MDNPGVARITVPRRARNRLGLKLAVPCWPPPRARERGLSGIGIGEDPTSPVHRAASAPPPCLPPASAGVSCISSATLAELIGKLAEHEPDLKREILHLVLAQPAGWSPRWGDPRADDHDIDSRPRQRQRRNKRWSNIRTVWRDYCRVAARDTGRHVQLHRLGHGNFSDVKLTAYRHRPTGLKMVRKDIVASGTDAEITFKNAMWACDQLEAFHRDANPWLISVFVASVAGHKGQWTLSLFMEHMEHGSLADIVARTNRIPEEIGARIAADICAGFDFVRGYAARSLERQPQGVVGRGCASRSLASSPGVVGGVVAPLSTAQVGRINPERVMVAAGGSVKLAFNWPTDQVKNAMESHTTPLSKMRSAHFFMAPEVLLGEAHSEGSAVWGLGLTLIEVLVGRSALDPAVATVASLPPIRVGPVRTDPSPMRLTAADPWAKRSIFEMLAAIVEGPAPRLPRNGLFSAAAQAFVGRCCVKDSAQRSSTEELLALPWITESKVTPAAMAAWASSSIYRTVTVTVTGGGHLAGTSSRTPQSSSRRSETLAGPRSC